MIDKWLIVGGAHYAVTAVVLKLLGLLLPCCCTGYYTGLANFLLFVCVARLTFELTKKWYLDERLQPENRAVFITGCDTGFGHAAAKALDAAGFPVFAGCLDAGGAGARELGRSCSKRLQVLQVDVTQDDSVRSAAEFVKDNLGTSELWAIVNNAGILRGLEVELTGLDDFRATMEVNGFGPVRVTKRFLPMLRQSRGRVVNVTSRGGRLPMPYCTPYIMSKHAAVAFSECLAMEMQAWGIRVISIEPEFFRTNIATPETLKKQIEGMFEQVEADVREDYGEKYFRSLQLYAGLFEGVFCRSLDPVVDAVERAVGLQHPAAVYTPCRNVLSRMLLLALENLPRVVCHTLIRLFLAVSGFPKPREAENYL